MFTLSYVEWKGWFLSQIKLWRHQNWNLRFFWNIKFHLGNINSSIDYQKNLIKAIWITPSHFETEKSPCNNSRSYPLLINHYHKQLKHVRCIGSVFFSFIFLCISKNNKKKYYELQQKLFSHSIFARNRKSKAAGRIAGVLLIFLWTFLVDNPRVLEYQSRLCKYLYLSVVTVCLRIFQCKRKMWQ